MSVVALWHCDEYSPARLDPIVREALSLRPFSPGMRVLVKANMLAARAPESNPSAVRCSTWAAGLLSATARESSPSPSSRARPASPPSARNSACRSASCHAQQSARPMPGG